MIYCVEDDAAIRELVVYTLQNTGFTALGLESGELLQRKLHEALPELLLLDIMLPGKDGIALLRELRANPKTARLPVILLTAKGAEYDKVLGLDCGADDYITKPFGMMELVSRIRALLRRTAEPAQPLLRCGVLEMNPLRHSLTVSGAPVELTLKEFELLALLLKSPGRVFTRDALLAEIWGYGYGGETRTVDVHIRTLRQKLGAAGESIETVRGVGYRMGELGG